MGKNSGFQKHSAVISDVFLTILTDHRLKDTRNPSKNNRNHLIEDLRIHQKNCHQCGVNIPQKTIPLKIRYDDMRITGIAVTCKNGHQQPARFDE